MPLAFLLVALDNLIILRSLSNSEYLLAARRQSEEKQISFTERKTKGLLKIVAKRLSENDLHKKSAREYTH
ncbi:hypothetical protein DesyoDRAFT_2541 [Desulfosporosinus youngiae DSM 17734]|uniref:Uncharacterized protein n=1 Tax=Desulfosporosinus youngiae DSM 17734 TaxID=768710 RepID=H5Y4K9_9FIRM|nr:hypothetical protein DesyoDRAFT_2541 [Desulfosporosinus youngiae DSM 17734]